MQERPEHWTFGPAECPVLVSGAERLLIYLPFFLNGWDFKHCEFNPHAKINIEVLDGTDGDIVIHQKVSLKKTSTFRSHIEAAKEFADILIATYAFLRGDVIYLRGSATVFASGITVFLVPWDQSEEQLALRLAARGLRLFSDEKIFLRLAPSSSVSAVSPGNTPSVALPLREDPNSVFEDFVNSFTEIKNSNRGFLKLWDSECAGFNEEATVTSIFQLQRSDCDESDISVLTADLACELIIENCQLSDLAPERHRNIAKEIAKKIPISRLRYNSFDQAARALLTQKID